MIVNEKLEIRKRKFYKKEKKISETFSYLPGIF